MGALRLSGFLIGSTCSHIYGVSSRQCRILPGTAQIKSNQTSNKAVDSLRIRCQLFGSRCKISDQIVDS
ncbi:hypothetical protein ACLKA7_003339 [Drosophila subpalustris]